jgi:FKBP-type peptidyl-prolyl cis-trans isomerase
MNKKSILYIILLILVLIFAVFYLLKNINENKEVAIDYSSRSEAENLIEDTNKKEEIKNNNLEVNNLNNMDNVEIKSLDIKVLKEGDGDVVSKAGDKLTMNYTGKLLNGTTFDSNVDPNFGHVSPFEFMLGTRMVISGWDNGLLNMKVGEKRLLTIPAEMAYGSMSPSPLIPPNSPLVFEVELLKIN